MQVIYGVLYVMFLVCMMAGIFFGMPKLMEYIDMNLARDHLENRAQRKVKDLRSQLRVIELEKEAGDLEKKLKDRDESLRILREMNERAL